MSLPSYHQHIPRNPTPVAPVTLPPDTPYDLLILGAGWTSTFLIPRLKARAISFAATTTTGHFIPDLPTTIPFRFEPESDNKEPYQHLPAAHAVLITFPLKGRGQSTRLVEMYDGVHAKGKDKRRWIQLGSTGVWKGDGWHDRHSPVDLGNPRAVAEEELLALCGTQACVLNLAGLWGGKQRHPRNWVGRVARTKEDVRGKGALHLVHGEDVARGVVGCLERWEGGVEGGRWLVDDLRGWDWWDLMLGWEGEKEYGIWVAELMVEEEVRALPRGREMLGRVLDGREFWSKVGMVPVKTLLG
ncbi:MAG: hypothetical protein Q9219_000532 [cf. Caloplaca sp. 3 TL-2023]